MGLEGRGLQPTGTCRDASRLFNPIQSLFKKAVFRFGKVLIGIGWGMREWSSK